MISGKAEVIPLGLEPCAYVAMNIRLRIIREYVDSKFVSFWFWLQGSYTNGTV